jgi:nitrite reductase/ring-hydroxylating ferredoxin subunit
MTKLLSDAQVIERVFQHIDNKTTDRGDEVWREPTENYRSEERFAVEMAMLRRLPLPYCPSAALPETGSFIARTAAGTPLVVARGQDGVVRAFRNACRHRGRQLAEGSGCTRSFVCGYHGWAYRLDGCLQHIPHEEGFPQVDKSQFGLMEVQAEERGGIIFVTQEKAISDGALTELPEMLSDSQTLFDTREVDEEFNWKLNMEAAMEGYHIKPTHKETFYPYGYDNLNVVEKFGCNSRVTFPFRRIEELRDVPDAERDIAGMVTYAHTIFPNVLIAVLSNHTVMSISEPLSPSRTHLINYRLTNRHYDGSEAHLDAAKYDAAFVAETGAAEDLETTRSIQAGLNSNANTHFTYGYYEKAIVHFHKNLAEMIRKIEQG